MDLKKIISLIVPGMKADSSRRRLHARGTAPEANSMPTNPGGEGRGLVIGGIEPLPRVGTRCLALLPCGARLVELHDGYAYRVFSAFGPFNTDRYALREGDAAVLCRDNCIVFDRCPLVNEIVNIRSFLDSNALAKRLLVNCKTSNSDGNLADVGNGDRGVDAPTPVDVDIRFVCIKLNRQAHFIVPPMAKIVNERDQRGSSCDNAGNGGDNATPDSKEVKNNDFHAPNSTTNF